MSNDTTKKITTDSGIEVNRIYKSDGGDDAGKFPFTRGVQPDMYS